MEPAGEKKKLYDQGAQQKNEQNNEKVQKKIKAEVR